MPEASAALLHGFLGLLGLTLFAAIVLAKRWGGLAVGVSGLGLGFWTLATGALAYFGIIERWDLRPPPALVVFPIGALGAILLSRSQWAGRLAESAPLFVLIGFHAFRVPLELLLHRAYRDGVMPIQMSFEGWNFDITTGLLAIVLGLWARFGDVPRPLVVAFNWIGLVLLATIVSIAIASTPVFAAFGPNRLNLWVARVPYIWLPTIFVTFALFGHLLLFQRLASPLR